MTGEMILLGACAGIAATVTMDIVAMATQKIGLTVGAKGEWVGRWYLGMAQGRFAHVNIAASPPIAGEKRAALAGHYVIGIVLAVFYVAGAEWLGLKPDRLLPAVGFGLGTCVFPWFLVLPALGFGALGLKGPLELRLLRSTLLNHLSYGFGLWWSLKLLPVG